MNKLLSTLVLTVAITGSGFANPPSAKVENPIGDFSSQFLEGTRSVKLQESMNSSFIFGAEGFSASQIDGHSSQLSKRVKSSDDLVADYDSDEEREEKEARISRQNSQENLKDALSESQKSSGFWSKCGSAFKSVKNTIVKGFYAIKTCLFG
ncbi:MAG TPA: hypothetical protein VNJ29_02185 [Candidatus Nitrosotenuis sp.]|jgi:hypothetical protein|nr:hypothetical protein [Candidatus Nitrosotenuis sp.]